ncbi:MAG TPA: hypothetical protein VM238_13440 [Phycisphaerae bacterium]|nr:hypothetical protein [Phycisphaerae bacterium]
MAKHPQTSIACSATCPACGKRWRWTGRDPKALARQCSCGQRLSRMTIGGMPKRICTMIDPMIFRDANGQPKA